MSGQLGSSFRGAGQSDGLKQSPTAVADRLRTGLINGLIYDGQPVDVAADIIGVGHATMYRRRQREAEFTLPEFVRAICHMVRIDGRRDVLDQFVRDVVEDQRGDPLSVRRDALATAQRAGVLVAEIAGDLADNDLSRDERANLSLACCEMINTIVKLQSDLSACDDAQRRMP